MKEKLPQSVEGPRDFLRGVLGTASKTKTLVFNEIRRGYSDCPRAVANAGLSFLLFGPLFGVGYSLSALQSPISRGELAIVTFYSGVITGASVLMGINLMRKAARMQRIN